MHSNSLSKIPTAQEFWKAWAVDYMDRAQAFASYCQARPEFFEESLQFASRKTLKVLLAVGSGKVLPEIGSKKGKQYDLACGLEIPEQKLLLEKGVEVLEPNGDSRWIPLPDVTPDQARQAIGRTLAQQRTWLNQHTKPSHVKRPFVVRKNDVVINQAPFTVDKQTLINWLSQIS